ncbi:MAG: ABC transporter substrate-binding protein [Deltaproteobacteria bacterium]
MSVARRWHILSPQLLCLSRNGQRVAAPSSRRRSGFEPETGAHLRVLRWSRFVQGDIDTYLANTKRFTEQTGIEVHVDSEGWEDVRPKAAVAANAGAGPDIILATNDDANLYAEKLVDVTDICEYLANKYGGFYPSCDAYLRPDGKNWIGVPLGGTGALMVYRDSHVKAAGFETFPRDTDGFLKMFKALKEKGTPGGMALGNATGDSGWTHWLMWAFGGSIVDKDNRVVINSPATLRALEYAAELFPSFVPGTLSWLDPNNNKAFLDGQISATNNGISIYYAAKELARSETETDGRRHPSRIFPRRPCRHADGVPSVFQSDDHEVHEVHECREGVPAFHDGARAVRCLAGGGGRLCFAAAPGLRELRGLVLRREAPSVPRLGEESATSRLRG